jgi:hypothetical protein
MSIIIKCVNIYVGTPQAAQDIQATQAMPQAAQTIQAARAAQAMPQATQTIQAAQAMPQAAQDFDIVIPDIHSFANKPDLERYELLMEQCHDIIVAFEKIIEDIKKYPHPLDHIVHNAYEPDKELPHWIDKELSSKVGNRHSERVSDRDAFRSTTPTPLDELKNKFRACINVMYSTIYSLDNYIEQYSGIQIDIGNGNLIPLECIYDVVKKSDYFDTSIEHTIIYYLNCLSRITRIMKIMQQKKTQSNVLTLEELSTLDADHAKYISSEYLHCAVTPSASRLITRS